MQIAAHYFPSFGSWQRMSPKAQMLCPKLHGALSSMRNSGWDKPSWCSAFSKGVNVKFLAYHFQPPSKEWGKRENSFSGAMQSQNRPVDSKTSKLRKTLPHSSHQFSLSTAERVSYKNAQNFDNQNCKTHPLHNFQICFEELLHLHKIESFEGFAFLHLMYCGRSKWFW